jgi:chromosome segregation ATPase
MQIEEWEVELNFMEEQVVKQENEEIAQLKNQNSHMKRFGRRLKLVELQLQDDAANIKR